MARTSSSLKRIVIPCRDTMKMSSSPPVWMTPTSSSPSRRLMAMKPSRRDLSYSAKFGLLDLPLPGGEEQVAIGREIPGVDEGLDPLARSQRQQVDDGRAPGRALLDGDLVGPQPVHPAPVGEEQQVGVGRGVDDPADHVLFLQPGRPARPGRPGPGSGSARPGIALM